MLYLIRYGELALKNERARSFFERCLVNNIKDKSPKAKVTRERGRIFVEGNAKCLSTTFGIVSYSEAKKCEPTLKEIEKHVMKTKIKSTETFAIRVNRAWKQFPLKGQELEAHLGSIVAKQTKAKVDLSAPDKTIFVEVRKTSAYLFLEKLPGPGGLPVGSGGKVLALIKNKRDLLACWMLMKRGCKPIILTKNIGVKPLEQYAPRMKVYKDSNANIQKAKQLAKREKAKAIVTGDKLGVYDDDILILRPLVGFTSTELNPMKRSLLKVAQ